MPRLFTVISVLFGVCAAVAGCEPSTDLPLAAQIDAVFREAHHSGKFDGTVLVTRGDSVLYQSSFGFADIARNTANTADTRFLVFSVNKPLTAVLVFQLIEKARISLDDTLDRFFPNLAGKPAATITLAQLLTHTSGIEEIIERHPGRRVTPEDLETANVNKPGTFAYSSSGFVCLALALESVTGRSYASLLEQQILRPAGMADSGVLRSNVPVDQLAVGYRRTDQRRLPSPLQVPPEILDGAGSLYTTAADLWRFDRALKDGRLLSSATQDLMLKPQSDDRAFGWSLGEQDGKYFPWHKGSFHGYTAVFVRQTHRQEMVAILANVEDADVLALRTRVLRLLKRDAANNGKR
jgi:D-alanyl-D-alanine carboxypeptidase